jgi:putative GTP pyrophosphokinase
MKESLEQRYSQRFDSTLLALAEWIISDLRVILKGEKNVDRISARPKSIERFIKKSGKIENGTPKYTDPLNQIQDQVGARIIVFYLNDVKKISDKILEFYREIEIQNIIPESENEFGYIGKHFILKVPNDFQENNKPKFFELQIKTLFQHAWSEAEHDLYYKSEIEFDTVQKRKVAFTAAQAWGADMIFEELRQQLAI